MNELQTVDSELQARTARANKEIAAVRDAALDDIADHEGEATKLRNAIDSFAEANRDNEEIFLPGTKSLILHAGSIGFSKNPEQVVLRDGYSTEEVIEKAEKAGLNDIVKEGKKTLDKTAAKKLDDKELSKIGLRREQTESFYIKLNTLKEV